MTKAPTYKPSLKALRVEAEVLGYNRKWVWLRFLREHGRSYVGITMPRAFLPRGMATAEWVLLEYEPDSLHHDGHAYVLEGTIMERIDDRHIVDTGAGSR